MWNNFRRFIFTIRYLKWVQIQYQLYYKINRLLWGPLKIKKIFLATTPLKLRWANGIATQISFYDQSKFQFLNISHEFEHGIDWNEKSHGKLWIYNLNYFEFLLQPGLDALTGLSLIYDFLGKLDRVNDGAEPYPLSLRLMNWVKFISLHQIEDKIIDSAVLQQLVLLRKNMEFHLLGNHLLENAFALFWGAVYIQDVKLTKRATNLLIGELKEQILPDGAHFELSPMYHQIILWRVLDTINLLVSNPITDQGLLIILKEKAAIMLGWISQLVDETGNYPNLNDSAFGVAPPYISIVEYAQHLGICPLKMALQSSGYRSYSLGPWNIVLDIGPIGPDYIPGHAHSDTLSFVLRYDHIPFIIDVGISTYEKNHRRQWERSTAAHNTVQIEDWEQTEVWGGFRVGRRAKPIILYENNCSVRAGHDGYASKGIFHYRQWSFNSNGLEIIDQLEGNAAVKATARFYLHPSRKAAVVENTVHLSNIKVKFTGASEINIIPYDYPEGYNCYREAACITVTFQQKLHTWISH